MKSSNAPKKLRGVGVYIFADDRVLLAQRGPAARHEQYKWEGVGGEVEPDETYEQAAERETLEELGISVQLGEVIAEFDTVTDSLGTVWEAKIFSGSISDIPNPPDHTKVAGFGWFTREEVVGVFQGDLLADYSVKDLKAFGWL